MGVLLISAAIAASVAVGVVVERRRPRAAALASRRALTLILYVLIPPVIFFNLAASDIDVEHGVGLALGLVSVILTGLLVWWVASRILRLSRPRVGATICAVISVNSAYLGYPMTVALLGRDDLPTAVLYDLAVAAPSVSARRLRRRRRLRHRGRRRPARPGARLLHPQPAPLRGDRRPARATRPWRRTSSSTLSQALVIAILPIGFFAVGATLAENAEHGELPMPPPLTRPVALAVVARLAIAPGLLILMAAPLVDLPAAYLLIAAMPTGINSMVVAHAYGLDMEITAEAVTWSTANSRRRGPRLPPNLTRCSTTFRSRSPPNRSSLRRLLEAARLRASRCAGGARRLRHLARARGNPDPPDPHRVPHDPGPRPPRGGRRGLRSHLAALERRATPPSATANYAPRAFVACPAVTG